MGIMSSVGGFLFGAAETTTDAGSALASATGYGASTANAIEAGTDAVGAVGDIMNGNVGKGAVGLAGAAADQVVTSALGNGVVGYIGGELAQMAVEGVGNMVVAGTAATQSNPSVPNNAPQQGAEQIQI